MPDNALYAQSGGVTAVINATACGLIETAKLHSKQIGTVFAARNGIIGALQGDLIDTFLEPERFIRGLRHTPGGAFGSCRYKLKSYEQDKAEYEKLMALFKKYNIRYFFYNGGGDSQDTAHKIAIVSKNLGFPIHCIGIPKTIDNDLLHTDNCPGFGSVAKYVAISTRETGLDVASMASSSTQIFILEVMGRHAGWIAAGSGLAKEYPNDPPHIILFPEIPFDEQRFLEHVKYTVKTVGYCVIVAAEGVKYGNGKFISEAMNKDAFGHVQLGGVAPKLASLIKQNLGIKYHWAVSDYLQRSARHIASQVDVDQAYALGKSAIEYALAGKSGIMLTIVRKQEEPYQWEIGEIALEMVANKDKLLPRNYITEDGYGISASCIKYLKPLIQGEAYPPYKDGLPDYVKKSFG